MERWMPIGGWPLYDISDCGNVRSWASRHKNKPIIRRANKQTNGYVAVTFESKRPPKRNVRLYIHRLVAQAFCERLAENTEVAHLDGNKTNNDYRNLAWVTRRTNHSHKIAHGTHRSGERHQSAKYTDRQYLRAIKLRQSGFTYDEIHGKTGISGSSLCLVLKGKSRKHLLKTETPVIKRQA